MSKDYLVKEIVEELRKEKVEINSHAIINRIMYYVNTGHPKAGKYGRIKIPTISKYLRENGTNL